MTQNLVAELSPLDATLILFAAVARPIEYPEYNGMARAVALYAYSRRGIKMQWLPEELRQQAKNFVDDSSEIFHSLESLCRAGLLTSVGSCYAVTSKGAFAIADLMRERGYTLDDLTQYVGR